MEGSERHTLSPKFNLAAHAATVVRRTDALFKAMSTDFLLREQFVTEPTQILSEYVHGRKLPPEEASVSDQLLYAVMSSQSLLRWVRDYAIRYRGHLPSREGFVKDFATAVVSNGASHVVLALARASVEKQDVFGADGALSLIIDAIARDFGGFAAQTEMSTGHSTGTEMSTGHTVSRGGIFAQTEMSTGHSTGTEMSTGHSTGTEMSTGHTVNRGGIFAQTEMSTGHSTGTEMSTGHSTGTEMSTGHTVNRGGIFAQTEMSTGHSTGTEMSTGHSTGTEMSTGHTVNRGGIFAQTEMSTGHSTGTEMSTGHSTGTEKSTGELFGRDPFVRGFIRVTLATLVEHAIQLRNRGALDGVFDR